jgi:hypothetical protein
MKRFLIIPGIVVLLIGLGLLIRDLITVPAHEVKVTLSEYDVRISANLIAVDEPVKFTIFNNGRLTHNVVLERVGAINAALSQGEGKETAALDGILPGETRVVMWTINNPGEYQLACHLPGHFEGGMAQSFSAGTGIDDSLLGQRGGLILIGMGFLLLTGTFLGAISISQQNRVFIYSQVRARPTK